MMVPLIVALPVKVMVEVKDDDELGHDGVADASEHANDDAAAKTLM